MKRAKGFVRERLLADVALVHAGEHSDLVETLVSSQPHQASLEALIEACPGGWSVDEHLGRVVVNAIVRAGRDSVLEIGAGASSVLIARTLGVCGGGSLTSVEQDPAWCADHWSEVESIEGVDAELVVSDVHWRLGRLGVFASHHGARREVTARGPYDLVLVDGPQYWFGREGAMPLIADALADHALVLVDDARLERERWTYYKWQQTYPGVRLAHLDRRHKGLAILVADRRPPRFSMLAFIQGCRQGIGRIRALRVKRRETPDA